MKNQARKKGMKERVSAKKEYPFAPNYETVRDRNLFSFTPNFFYSENVGTLFIHIKVFPGFKKNLFTFYIIFLAPCFWTFIVFPKHSWKRKKVFFTHTFLMASSNPGSNRDVTKDEAETMSKRMTTIVGILD